MHGKWISILLYSLPVPPQGVVPTDCVPANPIPLGVVPTFYTLAPLPPQGMVPTICAPSPLSPQGQVPTLRDLCLLPVPNWYLLGLQLGVSADELDVIEKNYPRDTHMCKAKMFGAWLRMDTSPTYRKLARALVTVGKRNIAEEMLTAKGRRSQHCMLFNTRYTVYCTCIATMCTILHTVLCR